LGSIPIARSINLVDSVALTPGNELKFPSIWSILFQRCSKTFLIVPKALGLPDGWKCRENLRSTVRAIANGRGGLMPTKEQLQERVEELEQENDKLQDQLDQIFDIVAPPAEEREDRKDGRTTHRKSAGTSVRRNSLIAGHRRRPDACN
jgi:hypothetical protein